VRRAVRRAWWVVRDFAVVGAGRGWVEGWLRWSGVEG
jgi:hypothetical protein